MTDLWTKLGRQYAEDLTRGRRQHLAALALQQDTQRLLRDKATDLLASVGWTAFRLCDSEGCEAGAVDECRRAKQMAAYALDLLHAAFVARLREIAG
jgi:hypothetical protein